MASSLARPSRLRLVEPVGSQLRSRNVRRLDIVRGGLTAPSDSVTDLCPGFRGEYLGTGGRERKSDARAGDRRL